MALKSDPVERLIDEALQKLGVSYVRNATAPNGREIDFRCAFPEPIGVIWIECKQFSTHRTDGQLHALDDAIVIQGVKAAKLFLGFCNTVMIMRQMAN